jgi:Zn-dependent M32 family carboxypeptidase
LSALRTWLKDRLYVHGAELPADALVERIAGRALDVEPFFRRLERRVAELE